MELGVSEKSKSKVGIRNLVWGDSPSRRHIGDNHIIAHFEGGNRWEPSSLGDSGLSFSSPFSTQDRNEYLGGRGGATAMAQ